MRPITIHATYTVFEDRQRLLKFDLESMRNPRFKAIRPNYRKRVLEVTLQEGRRMTRHDLPFAAFAGKRISARNRFVSIDIDAELGGQAATFRLADGTRGDFPADLVLYYCDPTYDWSPINQLKRVLRDKLDASRLSVRVLADALRTSPSQVTRLLQENRASKQLLQLLKLAELAGYRVTLTLKRKPAA
jgi:hypothetical protein